MHVDWLKEARGLNARCERSRHVETETRDNHRVTLSASEGSIPIVNDEVGIRCSIPVAWVLRTDMLDMEKTIGAWTPVEECGRYMDNRRWLRKFPLQDGIHRVDGLQRQ